MLYTIFLFVYFLCFSLFFFGEISFAFQHERNGLQSWVYIGLSKVRFQFSNFTIQIINITYAKEFAIML